jgi:polygalacturonase
MSVVEAVVMFAALAGMERSIVEFGAVAGVKSTMIAEQNAVALTNALRNASDGDTVVVPTGSFYCNGGIIASGIHGVTLRVDGTLFAVANFSAWPIGAKIFDASLDVAEEVQVRGSEYSAFIAIDSSTRFTLRGSGLIDGGGIPWWNQYVLKPLAAKRPKLIHLTNATDVLVEEIHLINSPSFHLLMTDVARVEVSHISIIVDRAKLQELKAVLRARRGVASHGSGFPLQPEDLNTDGIDPAGRDVWIHDCVIVNDDDSIAVKPLQLQNPANVNANCSENMVIERMNITGMGLSIGSVPPHVGVNCVRNITFRDIVMPGTGKGVYVKSNPSCAADGSKRAIIANITYANITINEPKWWSIWIGPQQQHEPGSALGDKCALDYPISKSCPTQGCVDFQNIVLRDIVVKRPLLSPGVLLGNASNPMGVTFENVVVEQPGLFPFGHTYKCEHVSGTATDSTPKPPCMSASLNAGSQAAPYEGP